MTEPTYDELKARLEKAEDMLRTLEHGEVDAVLSRDGPGLVRSMHAIALDQQLLDQQFYSRSLIEASLDPLVTINAEGKITDVNEASVQATGVPREQLIGTDFSDYFTDPAQAREVYQKVFSEGFVRDYPLAIRHVTGRITDVLYNASVYKDDKGNILGIFAAARDVTQQKQDNIALKESEERFLTLADNIPQLAWMGDAQGSIFWYNQRWFNYSGTTLEDMQGWGWQKIHHPDYEQRVVESFKHSIVTGEAWEETFPLRNVDGEYRWFLSRALPIRDKHGATIRWFGTNTDITEYKLQDQILQEKHHELEHAKFVAERANLAKSDFLSQMSHELRTPLNAILGFAQLLETGKPSLTPVQVTRLNQILKAGWYLLELINEILDLALIESGKSSISLQPVSLSNVLLECQAMFIPQAKESSIQLHFHMFDSTWFVHADQTKLKQVLTNLLSNAIKYNSENGTVEVKCSENTSGRLRISVKDSGMGLSAEKLAHLFQPFNRLGQEIGVKEGTGIGLAVSKRLVELMGGTIGVESTVGVGSEFWIELDRDVTSQSNAVVGLPEEFVPQPKGDGPRYTLLCVEDNPDNLMLVEQIIEDRPHVHMLSARDGARGIALAREQLPDIILMDINLPGISGIEAMILLRKDPATKHIPIIALSANAMMRDIDRGLKAGFFRYLTKPIKIKEFTEALDAAMASVGNEQPSA
jgi:PAS domain S-box-containing protein